NGALMRAVFCLRCSAGGPAQFDFEYQRREWIDQVAGTVGAISLCRWNHQSPLRTDRHVLQGAAPSADHTVETEPLRLTVLIEHGAVGKSTDVQDLDLAIRAGFR